MRIDLTQENIEDIAAILKYLLQSKAYGVIEINIPQTQSQGIHQKPVGKKSEQREISANKLPGILEKPPSISGLEHGRPYLNEKTQKIGTWGMFNTYMSGKAVLRVIANLMKDKNQSSISLKEIMDVSIKAFKEYGLSRFRGFPSTSKSTSVERLVSHFLTSMHEMGFIRITESRDGIENLEYIPSDKWESIYLTITKEGLEFATLENSILDKAEPIQTLTDEERQWLFDWLKTLDDKGFKEYSFIKSLYEYLKTGNRNKNDILSWFEKNSMFEDYIKSWSRKWKRGDMEGYKKQLANLCTTFMSSKIALLREFGLVSQKRNNYSIVGDWE